MPQLVSEYSSYWNAKRHRERQHKRERASRNEGRLASLPVGVPERKRAARSSFRETGAAVEQSRPALVQCIEAYFSQYTAVANVVVDHWMQKLSGSEFKVLLLFIRDTIGQESKRAAQCLESELTIDQIGERTGLNRESVVIAVRGLERTGDGLILAERRHRTTTRYSLNIGAVLAPRVGKSDSTTGFESENPTQAVSVESENPTLKGGFESENPTPYKEINKAAAAAALTAEEWTEVRRIEQHTDVKLDGKGAAALKAGAIEAELTLTHLRWFVQQSSFASARNRLAVLLTMAKQFRERAQGVEWPSTFDCEPSGNRRSFSAADISNL